MVTLLARRELRPHPQTPCDAVEQATVEIGVEPSGVLVVHWRIIGDIARLRVPENGAKLDPDRLWEHTCCELFVAPAASEAQAYVEWNFSPSGQLARFEFEAYRRRKPSAAVTGPPPSVTVEPGELQLQARVPLASDIGSTRISITAVIEDTAGALSYWALHHPCDRPDFHHRDGFSLALTLAPSPTLVDEAPRSPSSR